MKVQRHHTFLVLVQCFSVAGCVPVLKTVQPKGEIVVTDSGNVPIENATVQLGTFRGPFGPRTLAEFQTDASSVVSLKRNRKWEWNVYLPDGVSWYEWDLCVHKRGFHPVVLDDPDFDKPLRFVLETSSTNHECQWFDHANFLPEIIDAD